MLGKKWHNRLVLLGLLVIAIGLPLSKPVMSIGQFILAGNWLLEGRYSQKLKALFSNKLALLLIGVLVLHLIGMAWTEDQAYGWRDLRIKLPLFLMPFLVFTSEQITAKQLKFLLGTFVLAVFIGSLASTLIYFGITGEEILNRRKMMPFISHIRFSLMVVLSIGISAYYLFKEKQLSALQRMALTMMCIWLFFYLVLLESASGYAAFAALLVYLVIRGILANGSIRRRMVVLGLGLVFGVASTVYIKYVIDRHYYEIPFNAAQLEVYSPAGNIYAHSNEIPYCENGHRIYNYLQMDELRKEWPKVSEYDFDGFDNRGEELWPTLIRYMTSQGLRKDSTDFQKLTPHDIRSIENGVTNPDKEKMWGVAPRIEGFLWEYDKYRLTGDPSGSGLMLRMIYVRTGWELFKQNPVIGIGTGDTKKEYFNYYDEHGNLGTGHRAWAHNQIVTIFVCLGLIGGLWFLLSLVYPLTMKPGLLYMMFFMIVCTSFFADDTLETQAGATFYAFFNAVFLARRSVSKTASSPDPSNSA